MDGRPFSKETGEFSDTSHIKESPLEIVNVEMRARLVDKRN